jgi:hypothetical protein
VRALVACLFLVVGFASAIATYVWIATALTPQDSSIAADGDWGYGLFPAALSLACFTAGIQFLKPRE